MRCEGSEFAAPGQIGPNEDLGAASRNREGSSSLVPGRRGFVERLLAVPDDSIMAAGAQAQEPLDTEIVFAKSPGQCKLGLG